MLAAGVVGLAGCSTAQPGTAVEVDSARVSVADLQSRVDDVLTYRDGAGLPDVRAKLPQVTQGVLSADIVADLTSRAVARTGVPVDQQAIDGQLGSITDSTLSDESLDFLTPTTLRSLVSNQLVISQLGAAAWDGLAVTVDITAASDRAVAEAKATRMARGEADSAAVIAEDTAAGLPAEAGLTLSPATAPALAGYPAFTAPAGSAVAFQYKQEWQVARIVSRRTDAPAATAPDAVTAAQAGTNASYALGLTLLPQLAGNPAVTVSPRYGRWDPTQGQVEDVGAEPQGIVVGSASS